jgi:hypothetical protein
MEYTDKILKVAQTIVAGMECLKKPANLPHGTRRQENAMAANRVSAAASGITPNIGVNKDFPFGPPLPTPATGRHNLFEPPFVPAPAPAARPPLASQRLLNAAASAAASKEARTKEEARAKLAVQNALKKFRENQEKKKAAAAPAGAPAPAAAAAPAGAPAPAAAAAPAGAPAPAAAAAPAGAPAPAAAAAPAGAPAPAAGKARTKAAKAPTLAEIKQGINNRKSAMILEEQKKMKTSGMKVEPIQNPPEKQKGYTSFGGRRRTTVNKHLNKRSSRRSTYHR